MRVASSPGSRNIFGPVDFWPCRFLAVSIFGHVDFWPCRFLALSGEHLQPPLEEQDVWNDRNNQRTALKRDTFSRHVLFCLCVHARV